MSRHLHPGRPMSRAALLFVGVAVTAACGGQTQASAPSHSEPDAETDAASSEGGVGVDGGSSPSEASSDTSTDAAAAVVTPMRVSHYGPAVIGTPMAVANYGPAIVATPGTSTAAYEHAVPAKPSSNDLASHLPSASARSSSLRKVP